MKSIRVTETCGRTSRRLALLIGACALLLVLSACGEDAGTGNTTDTGADVGGDAFVDDTSADGDLDVIQRDCVSGVCFWLLEPFEYPESADEPVHGLHCNERGLASGCPLGTACGETRRLRNGQTIPICEAIADDLRVVDVDIPIEAVQPTGTQGIPVDLRVTLGGEALPERSVVAPSENMLSITHQDTGTQWSLPFPDGDAPVELMLLEGIHDVFIRVNGAAYLGSAIPNTTLRGLVEVVSAGQLEVALPNTPVDVRIRYQGSTLTGPESQMMRLTFENDANQTFNYQFTAGQRGIGSVPMVPGDYRVSLRASGLTSLFPSLPLEFPLNINVPMTESLEIDLRPELVQGTLELNGEAPPETGQIGFVVDGQVMWLTFSSSEPGVFRALLWPHQTYDILYTDWQTRTAAVLSEDWTPNGEDLEFDLDVEVVEVVIDLSETPFMTPSIASSINLELRLDGHMDQLILQSWESDFDDELDHLSFEFNLPLGQDVIAVVRSWGDAPNGSWPLGTFSAQQTNVLTAAWSDLEFDISAETETGTRLVVDSSNITFYHPDFSGWNSSIYMNQWNTMEGGMVFHGDDLRLQAQPYISSILRGTIAVELGTVSVTRQASYDIDLVLREIAGSLTVDGAPPAAGDFRRGTIQFISTEGGGSPYFDFRNGTQAYYEFLVAQNTFTIAASCDSEVCTERGYQSRPIMYDAVLLGTEQVGLVER